MFIGLLIFMLFMAFILALWEIQIEGQNGWAAKLPAWRIERGWLMKVTGGIPVTGYHICMTVSLIAIIHCPLFFVHWTWPLEFLLFGFYCGMVLLEDFLWFLLNPAYGLKKFRPGRIWWHSAWWGPVPAIYWILTVCAVILLWLGHTAI
jgi:hypothetical protein